MLSRLSCLAGRHRPVLPGEWNLGYCFSTCRHCNRDMVRSVLGGWKAPRAFRVVRGGALVAYEDLDEFLRSRDRPKPQASAAPPPPPALPLTPVAPRPPAAGPRAGSPFDFSDFNATAGAAPPPLKNIRSR